MVYAIVVPVDLQEPVRLEQLDGIDAYQSVVGGYVETSELYRPAASLFFNEDGKARQLPYNPRATLLWWTHNRAFHNRDVLVGPVLILGRPDENGSDTDVPQELVELLLHTSRYRVEVRTVGQTGWSGNELRYSDWPSAYAYAVHLAERWVQVKDVRVVADTPQQGDDENPPSDV